MAAPRIPNAIVATGYRAYIKVQLIIEATLASESRRGRGTVPKTLIDFGGVIGSIGGSTAS